MIERDLVPHPDLVCRFECAVDVFSRDARAEQLSRCVKNLHQIERDIFEVEESEIERPSWI